MTDGSREGRRHHDTTPPCQMPVVLLSAPSCASGLGGAHSSAQVQVGVAQLTGSVTSSRSPAIGQRFELAGTRSCASCASAFRPIASTFPAGWVRVSILAQRGVTQRSGLVGHHPCAGPAVMHHCQFIV